MDYIDYAYPDTLYIVEVKYSGDIAIATVRYNRKDGEPKEKDTAKGFTANFADYEMARRYARHIAEELSIKCVV